MSRRRRNLLNDDAGENFWPSFADLTSTIALILFVLVLLAYIQNLISGKKLEHIRNELQETMQRLRGSQEQITTAQRRLRLLAAEIENGQAQLKLSETRIEEQEEVIAESNRELAELRAKLSGIAVLRLDVLRKVKHSIEGELGRGGEAAKVSIADNGNIVLDESLLFETNSHRIKSEGKPFLQTLARAFANVLEDTTVRQNIDVVLVQGHTDERGSVAYNRELSAKRANAVLNYMFEAEPRLEQAYGSYFASSAYSEFRPISDEKTEHGFQQNRRIEISVVLKDSGVRNMIDEYMNNLDPVFRKAEPAPPSAASPAP